MNRLFYNRCYLSGAIDQAEDYGQGWRRMVIQELRDLQLIFLDPCQDQMLPEHSCESIGAHQHRNELKEHLDFETLSQVMRSLRCIDLRKADLSDFAIVHFDLSVPTTGTHEEIVTMNRRKIPILTHVEQGKINLPDWYWGTLPRQMIFSTWGELFTYVRHVAYDPPPIDTYKRWRFLDYRTLYGKK